MQRILNIRLVSAALIAAVAVIGATYALVQHWVAQAKGLSVNSCTQDSIAQAQSPDSVQYVNCGGFLE